jgi:hypothetical protein
MKKRTYDLITLKFRSSQLSCIKQIQADLIRHAKQTIFAAVQQCDIGVLQSQLRCWFVQVYRLSAKLRQNGYWPTREHGSLN